VSNKLKRQIQIELEQMDLLLKRHPGLIEKCRHEAPNNYIGGADPYKNI
jgi:hypothetical protein